MHIILMMCVEPEHIKTVCRMKAYEISIIYYSFPSFSPSLRMIQVVFQHIEQFWCGYLVTGTGTWHLAYS